MPDGGVRTSLTGAASPLAYGNGVNVSFGPNSFYGPGQPLPPISGSDQQVRGWDFPVGFNTNTVPRHSEPFNFSNLRAFSNVELVRLAIETRKDQLEKLDWQIKGREDNKRIKESDARIEAIEKFLMKPDGITPFSSFMRQLDEDLLSIDAMSIELRRTRGGKLAALEIVPGDTINLLIDQQGRRPAGPNDLAFQQIIKGSVWANLTNRDLMYVPRNVRPGHVYGFSPVEQIIVTINTLIRRQASQLGYFTDGNIPAGYMSAPEGWTNQQIKDLQDWFDGKISGNQGEQRKIVWGPFGAKYQAFKDSPIKDEFDEWLARVVAFAFSLPPTPYIRQMNKGTAGEDQERALEEGLEPIKLHRKRWIDQLIATEFNAPDLEFVYAEERTIDAKLQMEIDDKGLRNGSLTIDEVRDRRGDDKLPNGLGEVPRVYLGAAVLPLDVIDEMAQKGLEAQATATAMAPQKDVPIGGQVGPDGKPIAPKAGKAPPTDANSPPSGAPKPDQKKNSKKSSISEFVSVELSKYSPDQARDDHGRFGSGSGISLASKADLKPLMEKYASEPQEHVNIINMKVEGQSIFNPEQSLGLSREQMPQIPDDQRQAFLSEYKVELQNVDPSTLGPTQNQIDSYKVGLSVTGKLLGGTPIVSSDNKIIDGHHHWAGAVVQHQMDPSFRLQVYKVDAPRDVLMAKALAYDSAHGITGETMGESRRGKVMKALAKYSENQERDERGRFGSGGGSGETHVMFEVGPNPDNKDLSERWGKLSDGERQAVTDKISAEMTPQVLDAVGASGNVIPAIGGFEGDINPSLVLSVSNGDPFKIAGALGDTFGQKAMVVMSDKPGPGLSKVGMVSVSVPGAGAEELRGLQGKIGNAADGFTYSEGKMQILNFSGQSNSEFAHEIDNRLGNAYNVDHANVYSSYIEAKDYASPRSDSQGNAWKQTAGSLRSAFSQRLEEALGQGKTGKVAKLLDEATNKALYQQHAYLHGRVRIDMDRHVAKNAFKKIVGPIGKTLKLFGNYLYSAYDYQNSSIYEPTSIVDYVSELIEITEELKWIDVYTQIIEAFYLDTSHAALESVGADASEGAFASIGVDNASDLVNRIEQRAADYARSRGEELVSADGEQSFVASTSRMVGKTIADGLERNIGRDAIAEELKNSYAFSAERAMVIANNEIAMANSHAKLTAWQDVQATGATMVKQWYISEDEGVCDECEGNAAQGEIDFDDVFESGDDMEPAHVNCRCVTTARVINPDGSESDDEEES